MKKRQALSLDSGRRSAIAGHIDLRARPERAAAHRALLGMGVHRDQRRKGLGVRLIDASMAWARDETGIDWIDLEVLSNNRAARDLYARTGFATVGEMPDMFRIDGEQHAYTFMTRRP
ncbi:GNAT family N-acetyltransferase [Massilia polaris]|uniref:GNAT family N-acetyltransferase n=1 Tax=Massilia polaris TaxID=2728846 RepID=UPI00351D0E14